MRENNNNKRKVIEREVRETLYRGEEKAEERCCSKVRDSDLLILGFFTDEIIDDQININIFYTSVGDSIYNKQ